jgi:hypothetical protein
MHTSSREYGMSPLSVADKSASRPEIAISKYGCENYLIDFLKVSVASSVPLNIC